MHKLLKLTLLAAAAMPAALSAQVTVDRTKYPDYSDKLNPDPSLMTPIRKVGAKAAETRPDHVNNGEDPYFPPVFNQSGGSCGSASRICYMFSHEMNAFRGTDGKDSHNYYPSHFVWLLTNGNSGKDAFVQYVGVPSAYTYGGQTYSELFGYQEETNNDFGWMTGYEKWYEAMFNRMLKPSNFTVNVGTTEGREAVKNWLWNHNGDTDFHSGGIVGIGVASGGDWQNIPSTPTNDEIGVTGKKFVNKWGTSVDHALTVVGYDDRIEFDLNGNGVYGEESADEKGAWIIVNSWGSGWCNGGFIYCPYAYAGPAFKSDGTFPGNWWTPEVYRVRKNYRPLRTIKVKMDYSRRSELYLSAGVSGDVNATEPEYSQAFDHFKYAGDGANGNTVPAPEIPMLGRWADGKLHTEPMEFGYDLTDLTANLDRNKPIKYFFIIDTKSTAQGSGKVYNASILDYAQDAEGVETPFDIDKTAGVEVQNKGKRTIISVVVQGEGVYAPENVAIADGQLTWTSPASGSYKVTSYRVYKGDDLLATVGSDRYAYTLPSADVATYGVSAVYGDKESNKVTASVPAPATTDNQIVNFKKMSGFSIPDVFGTKYETATIEFWMNCNSLANWNQSAGPGWGEFMFHANADGTFTAGWDTSNRANASGALSKGAWKHIAITVSKGMLKIFVNGTQKAYVSSTKYSGVGGFGALTWTAQEHNNGYVDAKMDEIRIWNKARTAAQIKADYLTEYGDAGLPDGLLAYYKGDLIDVGGTKMLRDHSAGQHHATILNDNYEQTTSAQPAMKTTTNLTVSIDKPTEEVYAGLPATFSATASTAAQTLTWTAEGAGVKATNALTPTFTFAKAGEQEIKVVATDRDGNTVTATTTVDVKTAPAPDASFTATTFSVPAGQRVTFLASNPQTGYSYAWSTPGADTETANTANFATSYSKGGVFPVTLTITSPSGEKASKTQNITVTAVSPEADFNVSPTVVVKGEEVTLTDKSIYEPTKWSWHLVSGENAIVSEKQNITFVADRPGIYDVELVASNGAGLGAKKTEHGLVICNADSKNGLNFSYDNCQVTPKTNPLAKDINKFTIDWWMRPATLAETGNGIGSTTDAFRINTTSDGKMQISLNGKTVESAAGYVIAQQWHHYAVTVGSGTARFYRDCVQISTAAIGTGKMPQTTFSIGTDDAPFKGQLDEFKVWNKALSATKLKAYSNQPIEDVATAEATDGLLLYYQFNQSSGSVTDATSNANTGARSGFGPEGDAWGLSKGVFCLNFDDKATDLTKTRLKNYKAPFNHTSNLVNVSQADRFYELTDWEIENASKEKNTTGAHVDTERGSYLCFVTTDFLFDDKLSDHKVYQTLTLPAGTYGFTANYGTYAGESAGCYLVVAEGQGLPNTADLAKGSIAYQSLEAKSTDVKSNTIYFVLNEQTQVSLGLLVNMSESRTLTFSDFTLTQYPVAPIIEGINTVLLPDGTTTDAAVFDMWGRRVTEPVKGQVYIIGNKKVLMK